MPCNRLIYKAFSLFMLPDKGSNLDIQIQNLTYYHYTIGQWEGKTTKKFLLFLHSFMPS